LLDNDEGPNTGGMGAVAPLKISPDLQTLIDEKIVKPTISLMEKKNFIYRGVLYFGLMITEHGPEVLEFNCRFGDPETQVILPLLDQDVGLLFKDVALGRVPALKFKNLFSSCVVLAAPGYPVSAEKGVPIEGDIEFQSGSSYFIHAGTKLAGKEWNTNGGRVLCAIGVGSSLRESLHQAYQQAEKVSWRGLQRRSDIGAKLLK
jgi:phosphoribosylamine--glycine ligase